MIKRITALLAACFMIIVMAAPIWAEEEQAIAADYHFVIDASNRLSDSNKAKIDSAANAVYQRNGVDLFSYITDETLEKPAAAAKKVYTSRADTDAALVLLFDESKVYIYSYGRANNLFSDEEMQDIMQQANAEDSYTKAFLRYINVTGEYLNQKGTLTIPTERLLPRVVDNAGLMSDDDAAALLTKLDNISENRQIDVVVVTEYSLGNKTSTQYADDFFDYNGYGFGTDSDGILLLIGMEDRDWAISTSGQGITIFTDRGQEYMTDKFVSYLSDGDYYGAFNRFADLCDEFIAHYQETGKAYDVGHMPKSPFEWPQGIAVSGIIGAVIGLSTVSVFKHNMKSVAAQAAAGAYTKPGSLKITNSKDLFLYNSVTRTRKAESSGGGGGSSTHSSSSGRSHGGSSGHF